MTATDTLQALMSALNANPFDALSRFALADLLEQTGQTGHDSEEASAHRALATFLHTERITRLDEFTHAYIACAIWLSEDEGRIERNVIGALAVMAPATMLAVLTDCAAFVAQNWDSIAEDLGNAGHDFYLTRNHDGTGFWDGDWEEPYATQLTDAAHAFGPFSLYLGDDGRIYHFAG